jgi:hypothetical protein
MDPEEDDIERFEEERELELYREYRDAPRRERGGVPPGRAARVASRHVVGGR